MWLLLAITCSGQTFYGSIVGSVTDTSGATVPQATVNLTNLERRTMMTDSSGNYQFVNLVPGQEMKRFEEMRRRTR